MQSVKGVLQACCIYDEKHGLVVVYTGNASSMSVQNAILQSTLYTGNVEPMRTSSLPINSHGPCLYILIQTVLQSFWTKEYATIRL